jgi:hypothetical protein
VEGERRTRFRSSSMRRIEEASWTMWCTGMC